MVTWRWVGLGVLCVAMGGCQEPTQIIQTAPPGAIIPPPAEAEKDAAQALGEQPRAADNAAAKSQMPPFPPAPPTAIGETKTTPSGVKYTTLKEGTGAEVKFGQTVKVHYTGTLEDGKEFDSSRKRNEPFPVRVGFSQVIKGWHEGLAGMKVGEVRKLTIPASAGYGATGKGPIPPNATLIFDIEALSVE